MIDIWSRPGHGESITKVCLALSVLHRLESSPPSLSPASAASASLAQMYERVGGSGGVVLVTRDGRWEVVTTGLSDTAKRLSTDH